MNILINGDDLIFPKAGINIYVTNLLKSFNKLDDNNQYSILLPHAKSIYPATHDIEGLFSDKMRMETVGLPKLPYKVFKYFNLRQPIKCAPFDLYHEPNHIFLNIPAKKSILTALDLAYYLHPEGQPRRLVSYFTRLFPKSLYSADRVISISHYTKKTILERFNVPEEKIVVIHLGYDKENFNIKEVTDIELVKKKYSLPENYILFVGRITDPRKNIVSLLKAYSILPKLLRDHFPLVLVSPSSCYNKEVLTEIDNARKVGTIFLTGFVEDKDLPYIYNGATLFIMPSIFEGFGLPVLEAMACGTPVISSNRSSLPEIVGDAGKLFDPCIVEEISDAIEVVLENSGMQQEMIVKGLERARLFSWEKTARETLEVYNEVISL